MTDERFRSQSDPTQPLLFIRGAASQDLPGAFLRTFGVNYYAYRSELQRIAAAALSSVDVDAMSVGFDDFDNWFHDETDEVIFPIDDDDLFAWNLRDAIKAMGTDSALVLWSHVMAGFIDFKIVPAVSRQILPLLYSNNWGVRKSFLRSNFDVIDAKQFLAHHHIAHRNSLHLLGISVTHLPEGPLRTFASLVHPRVALIGDCYGVDYMHVGSLQLYSALTTVGSPEESLRRYPVEDVLPIPEYIAWAEPYLREMQTAIPRLRRHLPTATARRGAESGSSSS
jgi:hypothetical protein